MSEQEVPDWANLVAQNILKESDRGCAIVAAELLSEELEQLLRAYCRSDPADVKQTIDPLFSGYGPLATFSARINLAYSLGILPRPTRDRLDIIRRLRNDFAHEWGPLDFNDPKCAARLAMLGIWTRKRNARSSLHRRPPNRLLRIPRESNLLPGWPLPCA